MTPEAIANIGKEAVQTAFMLAMPLIGAAFVTAVAVGVLQTVTQVREATLSFVPKLVAVFAVFLLALPWMLDVMTRFASRIFMDMPNYIK
ncbi:MAG: flagellar biosynthetic protein FliQ [Deltaproteobacteria bacterium]|nr:flagellar biosynthetic protein FliQ [Deltaproteobacteria bacterium]